MKCQLILVGLIFWATSASSSPFTMQLISFNGTWQNGYPYTVQLNSYPSFWAMCNDYYHDGAPGDVWQANLTNLGSGDLSLVRFASSGLSDYQEAAWILLMTYATPSSQWPDMNFAVWHIFNPTVPVSTNAQRWLRLAAANYNGVDYSEVYIATPLQIHAPPAGDQEFMFVWKYQNPPEPAIPEPGSLVLFATGALGMFAAGRLEWTN